MPEFDLPIALTFAGANTAYNFIKELEAAQEEVIWEQAKLENGLVIVRILNIVNLEEKKELEDAN